jgi:hypothetical protein
MSNPSGLGMVWGRPRKIAGRCFSLSIQREKAPRVRHDFVLRERLIARVETSMTALPALVGLDQLQAQTLVDHYHKVREYVTRAWEQRNRRYVVLVALLAVAALLSFVQGPIVQAIGTETSIELKSQLPKLRDATNLEVVWNILATLIVYNAAVVFDVLMIVFLITIFYLTADLFHRSRLLVDLYLYLALMEPEIRSVLKLSDAHVAFTREGAFYRVIMGRTPLGFLISFANRWMLGCLLLLFFAVRLYGDYPDEGMPRSMPTSADLATWLKRKNILFGLDVLTALLTLPLYWGYFRLRSWPEDKMREEIAAEARKSSI